MRKARWKTLTSFPVRVQPGNEAREPTVGAVVTASGSTIKLYITKTCGATKKIEPSRNFKMMKKQKQVFLQCLTFRIRLLRTL